MFKWLRWKCLRKKKKKKMFLSCDITLRVPAMSDTCKCEYTMCMLKYSSGYNILILYYAMGMWWSIILCHYNRYRGNLVVYHRTFVMKCSHAQVLSSSRTLKWNTWLYGVKLLKIIWYSLVYCYYVISIFDICYFSLYELCIVIRIDPV